MADVIVMGAGMSGVATARELTRSGLGVSVLEARHRLGGRIHTLRDFCSAPVEAGAECIHGTGAQTWPDVRAARLSVRPNPHIQAAMINVGHGTHWLPRALLHPEAWPTITIFRRLARVGSHDMSAREFIERRGYRGRARTLAEMVLTSHLPGDLDEIGVRGFVADGVLELETGVDHRVNEGYDRLVEHVARDLDIEYGFTVQTIEWLPAGVMVRARDGRERWARAAVSTLPAGVLQSNAVRFIPELPEGKRKALREMVMGPVLKILLRFEEPFWPRRLSTLSCGVGPVTLYWNVFYRAAIGSPVLTAYFTGPRAAALARISEAEAVARILEDLHRHFPRATPKLASWRRIDWSADPLACGGFTFLRPGAVGTRASLAAADTGALILGWF
jgi:monoamine oxidase